MTELEVLEQWNPFAWLGLDYTFLKFNLVTILNTWFIIGLLTILLIVCRLYLNKKQSVLYYLITSVINSFMDLVTQTLGFFAYNHFLLVFSLFLFILFCNCISVIPWTTEPTQDINTALAFGLIAFFYKEYQGIKANGFRVYIQEFLEPFFIMFPVNLIGHFSKIISISFRLFGNIFGGAIIMELYKGLIAGSLLLELIGLLTGLNFIILLFFGVFEGLIQAFVFAMLTLTYLSLALQKDEPAGAT
ncbi:MAG: F0F1 ATP synthase subunit A [Candidatus Babeliales bacterium]